MAKPLKEVQFREVEGNLAEALPGLYRSLDIEYGIDDATANIRRKRNDDGSVTFRIPDRTPSVNVNVVPVMPENGMREDQPEDAAAEYDVKIQPSADKTRRFLLFPKLKQGEPEDAEAKPYVVEVRENGKVYVSEEQVEDYTKALNQQLMLEKLSAPKNAEQEALDRDNVSFIEKPNREVLAGTFSAEDVIRVNDRFGKLLYDKNSQDEEIGAGNDPLEIAVKNLDNDFSSSAYITVKGKDGNEEVHLAQKYNGGYYLYKDTFKEVPEDHNPDIDENDPGYRQITSYRISEKRAAIESQIYHFDNAVCFSEDGKALTRDEIDAQLAKNDGKFVVYPSDGSKPRWAVNKEGILNLSAPFSEKFAFNEADFTEIGAVGDPATASKLNLPEGAYARDGQGRIYKEMKPVTGIEKNEIIEEAPGKKLPNRMLNYLSDGKNRLLVYDKPGAKPYLLECKNGVVRKSGPLDAKFELNEKDLDPTETKYKIGQHLDLDDISFAVDADGHLFDGVDAVARGLEKPDTTLFVYNKNNDLPYALKNKKGQILVSDQPISSQNQLPDSNFEPKASLDPKDIISIPSKRKYQIAKDVWEDLAKWKSDKEGADIAIHKEEERVKSFAKKEPKFPEEPEKPRFGFGSKVWRGFVKFFSLGRAETAAYVKYQRDLATYTEETLPEFEEKFAKYEKEHKDWEERLNGYKNNIQFYKDQKEKIKTVLPQLEEDRNREFRKWNQQKGKSEAVLGGYRYNTEVFLEGVSDLKKNGLSPKNLFAYEKIAEAGCNGKSIKDPEAETNLSAFVAAKMAGDTINHGLTVDSVAENPAHDRMCDDISSGRAMKSIANDPEYQKIIEEMGDGPIDAYSVYRKYSEKVISRTDKRDNQAQHELAMNRLKDNRQMLADNFGTQPLTQDSLKDIMRLTAYDDLIRYHENNSRYAVRDAAEAIANIAKDPENSPQVKDTKKFGPRSNEVIKAMKEHEKVAYQEMEKLSASAKSPAEKKMFDNMRKNRYQTTVKPMSKDNKHYSEIAPTLVTRTPAGDKVERIDPNDERLKNGTFEPGKSYVVTVKPVYTLDQMKDMYLGFEKKLEPPQAQNNGPQAG